MSFHVPKIYLSIEELARQRNIEYAKLNKGLGLEQMSLADVHEDASTMAANAVRDLIEKNDLDPRSIGRIYVGSESATDGSKPIASYVLTMLVDYFEAVYGREAFLHIDVVDMTFACIAGVDALHNTLDWVRADTTRQGIVVCTDNAKYELGSSGEYTQGAGAVAMLIKDRPRLIELDGPVGVATVGEHDFFKPLRRVSQRELAETVTRTKLNGSFRPFEIPNAIALHEQYVDIHSIFPVFDGPYSNKCYAERVSEAYDHFNAQKYDHELEDWDRIVFHLPYAFHGKRMFTDIFAEAYGGSDELHAQIADLKEQYPEVKESKLIAKTALYRKFVEDRIAPGQQASSRIGNLYTGSVFMSLMSLLEAEMDKGNNLDGASIGFCSYGSGSKSKVFEGTMVKGWETVAVTFELFESLDERMEIDFDTYEKLHSQQLWESVCPPKNEFYLDAVTVSGDLYGKRTYGYNEKVLFTI
jgi:hydroxymethylglutaryl-CoA synthase